MYIEKVNYQRTFNLGNYSSEKIGVEMVVNTGENAKEALEHCKKLVEEYHEDNVKRLKELGYFDNEVVETVQIQNKKSSIETAKDLIKKCTTYEELKTWEMMSRNNPELNILYNNKVIELSK